MTGWKCPPFCYPLFICLCARKICFFPSPLLADTRYRGSTASHLATNAHRDLLKFQRDNAKAEELRQWLEQRDRERREQMEQRQQERLHRLEERLQQQEIARKQRLARYKEISENPGPVKGGYFHERAEKEFELKEKSVYNKALWERKFDKAYANVHWGGGIQSSGTVNTNHHSHTDGSGGGGGGGEGGDESSPGYHSYHHLHHDGPQQQHLPPTKNRTSLTDPMGQYYRSKAADRIAREQLLRGRMEKEKQRQKQELLEKRRQYGAVVRDVFKPSTDDKLVNEREKRIRELEEKKRRKEWKENLRDPMRTNVNLHEIFAKSPEPRPEHGQGGHTHEPVQKPRRPQRVQGSRPTSGAPHQQQQQHHHHHHHLGGGAAMGENQATAYERVMKDLSGLDAGW